MRAPLSFDADTLQENLDPATRETWERLKAVVDPAPSEPEDDE